VEKGALGRAICVARGLALDVASGESRGVAGHGVAPGCCRWCSKGCSTFPGFS
jgi:hypothetical protein